ncbi:MAG: alpha-L-fucosidase [Rikenellaceae bacterium]|nr:alpha-L-fucosidase [Rikenellaceae bacterium]
MKISLLRRSNPLVILFLSVAAGPLCGQIRPAQPLPAERMVAEGVFEPTVESLTENYTCPEWFRDAKLGIWAHWSAQCVPEQGDWYARSMYVQGHKQYDVHIEQYGHPSEFGFMEIDNLWKADKWDPEALMELYKETGARYFVAMANHEDNFDAYDSKYHAWNSVNVGPKQDIIGTWARVARAHGMRFGVSNHSSHAWHWFQTAYGYDAEGPKAGVRYDAYRLTAADGKGKWWDGLDPQDLYGKPSIVIPDGFTTKQTAREWHDANNLPWTEAAPADNPEFTERWFFRLQDLMDTYKPDFVYLDNWDIPLGQAGLDIIAHYYNSNMARNSGKLDVVLTGKGFPKEKAAAVTPDYERSASRDISPVPFETGTCIGQWHYKKDIEYKSVRQVVQLFVDVVSKNGTMLLNIPQRGDGTIDDREIAFLKGFSAWTKVNGEGIFESRPWEVYGEGPTHVGRGRAQDAAIPYTQEDMRFTTKDGHLYVFVLALPNSAITVKSLANGADFVRSVKSIALVGSNETIRWHQTDGGLVIEKPETMPCEDVISFKIAWND